MNRIFIFAPILLLLSLSSPAVSQTPAGIEIQVLKAEDARAYDRTIEDLLRNTNPAIRTRAALAAGRIGSEAAVPALLPLLEKGTTAEEREMAAFALGEIESIAAADAILKALNEQKAETRAVASVPQAETRALTRVPNETARLVEAAGKIAAANPKDPKSKDLGEAILDTLEAEDRRGAKQSRDVVLIGLTAALRAKPDETNIVVAKFLTNLDARVRADAANTLSRVKAKNANEALRSMLLSDSDAVARANAARALGAAEDKMAFDLLLEAATEDTDSRVRVSAIRSLTSLKDAMAVDKLLIRGEKLLGDHKRSKHAHPTETNELLEIASTLGRLIPNTNDGRTLRFLQTLRQADKYRSPETEIAFARVSPEKYVGTNPASLGFTDPWVASAYAQAIQILAASKDEAIKNKASMALIRYSSTKYRNSPNVRMIDDPVMIKAMPDIIRAAAAFKPADLDTILRDLLKNDDVFIRATVADLLSEQPPSKENIEALKTAFSKSMATDKVYNDAQLGILDALFKLDKREATPPIWVAINSNDYLVRKKAFELLTESQKDPALANVVVEGALKPKKLQLNPFISGSKLGQILNAQADYKRASSRKNGGVRAVLTTQKGTFTIGLLPEDAPLTVDNFIKLAKSGYFNGVEVHRVVPNFVMQDGDPRGDGNGGPGWSIRCEINMFPYERGAVGMALSGKDTGGSQWFVTHSPQPHLDGGYTVFGRVNETGMKIVDNIVRGDKIISVKVIEGNLPQKGTRGRKR